MRLERIRQPWRACFTAWVVASLLDGSSALLAADRAAASARASISAADAKRHVDALADDAFEGREAGSRGGQAAASYIVDHLQRLGLEPAGDAASAAVAGPTYFQPFAAGQTTRTGLMRNILAMLPGSDPVLERELVVVSAHYDHVGYGTPSNSFGPTGLIHNGADDNASGVAGLLELAEACTKLTTRPRRTILLAFWDGEEKGLLGSSHFIRERPAILGGRPVAIVLNLDMIGRLRNERVEIYGARTATGLRARLARANIPTGLTMAFDWKIEEDSDHYAFIMAGIPSVMFHTGLHDQYHRPSDDPHLVNHAGMEPVTRLVFETLLAMADDPRPLPPYRAAGRNETDAMRRGLEMPAAPAAPRRWGIGTRSDPCEPAAPIVVRVSPDTPAHFAGLRLGDRIMAIDAEPLVDQDDLIRRLGSLPRPATITLDVERDGKMIRLDCRER